MHLLHITVIEMKRVHRNEEEQRCKNRRLTCNGVHPFESVSQGDANLLFNKYLIPSKLPLLQN
jgi:hypothetical protein